MLFPLHTVGRAAFFWCPIPFLCAWGMLQELIGQFNRLNDCRLLIIWPGLLGLPTIPYGVPHVSCGMTVSDRAAKSAAKYLFNQRLKFFSDRTLRGTMTGRAVARITPSVT